MSKALPKTPCNVRRGRLKFVIVFVIADAPAAGFSGGGASDYDEAWLKTN
jgi:hypothetical protein